MSSTTKGKPRRRALSATLKTARGVQGLDFHALAPADMPVREIFYPWEIVDWPAVQKAIKQGKVVRIDRPTSDNEEEWTNCARSQLGAQNVDVVFAFMGPRKTKGDSLYALWIAPKGVLDGILLDSSDPFNEDS